MLEHEHCPVAGIPVGEPYPVTGERGRVSVGAHTEPVAWLRLTSSPHSTARAVATSARVAATPSSTVAALTSAPPLTADANPSIWRL